MTTKRARVSVIINGRGYSAGDVVILPPPNDLRHSDGRLVNRPRVLVASYCEESGVLCLDPVPWAAAEALAPEKMQAEADRVRR